MLSLFRRLPAYQLNGICVGLGVLLVYVLVAWLFDARAAQAATTGAVYASLPHVVDRSDRVIRRVLVGGALACVTGFVMVALADHALLRGLAIALLAFSAMLGFAWGPRVGPISFAVVLAMVFSLAVPHQVRALPGALTNALGAGIYALWAYLSSRQLEARYRALAVANALQAAGALLRSRVWVLTEERDREEGSRARWQQIGEEARLAEALQNARDLVFPATRAGGRTTQNQASLILRLAELRELVLNSRLDLDLLGDDSMARYVRARLGVALRRLAEELDSIGLTLSEGSPLPAVDPNLNELPEILVGVELLAQDWRARLLPIVRMRLGYLLEEVLTMRTLVGAKPRTPLGETLRLEEFTQDPSFSLDALRANLRLDSPVFRHAVRTALALVSVYYFAHALPWATHAYWLLLSVAVVLRGTLDQTLSRRSARVLGTAIGCVLVTVTAPLASPVVLRITFFIAAGVAHAFVNVRYLLTAIAATVMALLQARLGAQSSAFVVVERLLDTIIGAAFASAFSYVLPSWERRALPETIQRALTALQRYAECALATPAPLEQRQARQTAYDALEAVTAALRRSSAEPKRVRPPINALVDYVDYSQRLMAHLSSLRLMLLRRAAKLNSNEAQDALKQARAALERALSRNPPAVASALEPPVPLELPIAPPDQNPLPWLLRRLAASVAAADSAGAAARNALAALGSGRVASV